jgi:hypothetical protein
MAAADNLHGREILERLPKNIDCIICSGGELVVRRDKLWGMRRILERMRR